MSHVKVPPFEDSAQVRSTEMTLEKVYCKRLKDGCMLSLVGLSVVTYAILNFGSLTVLYLDFDKRFD